MILLHIREATQDDNQQLIELQKKSPMGSDLILQLDSSPDFFNRSKGYNDWKVLVAEEESKILGSVSFATQEKTIDSSQYLGVYEYGFIVDPSQRRKGIASKLQASIEEYAIGVDADFLHLNVTEDNQAGSSFFTKNGFKAIRACTPLMFMAYKKLETDHYKIRRMRKGDIPVVVELLNEYHQGQDFYTPQTEETFTQKLDRLPFFNLDDIYLFEHDTIKAVAGYWDYNQIMRFTLLSYNTRWKIITTMAKIMGIFRPMPNVPGIGEQMSNWYIIPFAYRDSGAASQLLMHILNEAFEQKVTMVNLIVDNESHAYTDFDHLGPNKPNFTWYIKELKEIPEVKQIYIDPLDV